jgi:hypothetical protein
VLPLLLPMFVVLLRWPLSVLSPSAHQERRFSRAVPAGTTLSRSAYDGSLLRRNTTRPSFVGHSATPNPESTSGTRWQVGGGGGKMSRTHQLPDSETETPFRCSGQSFLLVGNKVRLPRSPFYMCHALSLSRELGLGTGHRPWSSCGHVHRCRGGTQ